jgi:membrane protein
MALIDPRSEYVVTHPGTFALQVIKAFRKNQGMLLAGAVAYYTLLSIVPLLILIVIGLSHFIEQAELLATLRRALEWIVPGQSKALVEELASFVNNRDVIGVVLLVTMIFFSSLAFTVLENAISVIFLHRIVERRRRIIVSLMLPFGYIAFIGAALVVGTFTLGNLIAIGEEHLIILGHMWSLGGFSRFALYCAGVLAEIILISSIYYFMPVGRLTLSHALIGGATAGLLWEIVRHTLRWYFGSLSQVSVVYGSLTTAIIALLSLEIAAALLLLGAQVIAEYERLGRDDEEPAPKVTTEPAPQKSPG